MMTAAKIQTLSERESVQQIVETIQHAEPGTAPFAFVVGSGFSHGLVPTVRELVETSLPLWVRSLDGEETFESLLERSKTECAAISHAFWKKFIERNAKRDLKLQLD